MKEKYFRILAVSFMLIGCLMTSIPKHKETQPLKWEKIPEIVQTADLPEPTEEPHELILHYDPIEPVSEAIEFSYEDAQRLMKVAQAEGGTEGVIGQYLIMRVVVNRVKSDQFPDSIQEVITQPSQFESYSNGTYQKADISTDSHMALAMLEANREADTEIIAFEANWNNQSLLRYFDMAYVYKGHTFYQIKKD